MTSMSWMSGKENIKVENRLLFEEDVIKAVDRHTKDDDRLDDDISCILEELYPISLQMVLDRIEDNQCRNRNELSYSRMKMLF